MALESNERYQIGAQEAKAAGKIATAALALFLEMKDMDVEHVLAINSVVAWENSCCKKKSGSDAWNGSTQW